MHRAISLDGTWKLRWYDGERGDAPLRALRGEADLERAWPARVPGIVHETLQEHGVIGDPNVGTNILAVRWVEEMLWHYVRDFEAPPLAPGERAWLVFDALDLVAVIALNGQEVGRHANAFYPCRMEVTERLRPGRNQLLVTVESGLYSAAHRSAAGYGVHLGHELSKRPWLRTVQSAHGWDWAPRLLNVGIPGSVRLEIASQVRLDMVTVLTELSSDLSRGTLIVKVWADGLTEDPVEMPLVVQASELGISDTSTVIFKKGDNCIERRYVASRPPLWWPRGHGPQPLFPVRVAVGGLGERHFQVGFRHIRINQDPHPSGGRYFVVEVNRKPIFCKGGNWVPVDTLASRCTTDRLATLLDRAEEAHFNLLRVWGGGRYEGDAFYRLCDERGFLVWQEFIFACAKYPATDEAFLADVKREAVWQIRRLAPHPSLVVWCGNNEMEQGNWDWGYDRGVAHPDYALFHLVLPRLVHDEDGTRYYQPSSPFAPDLVRPNTPEVGDQHPWWIGFGDTDFHKYRTLVCRFPNEGGILGPTSLPTVRVCTQRVGDFAWELHDNSVSYWAWTPTYSPDRMIEEWLGLRVREMSLEDYVYWGGVVQGSGLTEYIRNFRRRMFDCGSAVFWMYNDVWPCVRSWTIVDYYLRRTPAFWAVRRAFAPRALALVRETDCVRVYGINDGETCTASVWYGLMALHGGYPLEERRTITLPANSSTLLAEFDASRWDALGTDRYMAFAALEHEGTLIARDTLSLRRWKAMAWPKAHVTWRRDNDTIVFESSAFAWQVCLDLEGEAPLPDNFFDVWPDVPYRLPWPKTWRDPRLLRMGNDLPRPKP